MTKQLIPLSIGMLRRAQTVPTALANLSAAMLANMLARFAHGFKLYIVGLNQPVVKKVKFNNNNNNDNNNNKIQTFKLFYCCLNDNGTRIQ